ncbi:MAG: hypothetical protein GY925_16050 [Actinomycetia bacterium]|nr:hypothetical protein [Actinomycetes bacterium]
MRIPAAMTLAIVLLTAACGGDRTEPSTGDELIGSEHESVDAGSDELFPDVVDAEVEQDDDATWTFHVTLSSPYDTPQRYADAWRILTPDGSELGIRVLTHDHATEQPFTRSLDGVEIPQGIEQVSIEGRDQVSGWGGATFEVMLKPPASTD